MAEIRILTDSDETRVMSYKWAVVMGCSSPAEPAGVSIRLLLEMAPAVEPWVVRDSIKATVRKCDVCFGGCTVKQKYRPAKDANDNANKVKNMPGDKAGDARNIERDMAHDYDGLIELDRARTSTYITSPWADVICGRCNLLLRKRDFITGEIRVFVADHTHDIGKVVDINTNNVKTRPHLEKEGPAA